MEIRTLTAVDAEQVAQYEREFEKNKYTLSHILSMIANPQYVCSSAWENNHLVGYMFSLVSIDSVDVIKILVLTNYRRKGFGRELLNNIITTYSMKPIYLEVDESNQTAIDFYKALGFVKIHMRRNYYDYQKNAIIMVKEVE